MPITVPEFPLVGDFEDDDILYLVRGGMDKSVLGLTLKNATAASWATLAGKPAALVAIEENDGDLDLSGTTLTLPIVTYMPGAVPSSFSFPAGDYGDNVWNIKVNGNIVFQVGENGQVSGTWTGEPIPVSYGGTGAANAAQARENLGLGDGSDMIVNSIITNELGINGTFFSFGGLIMTQPPTDGVLVVVDGVVGKTTATSVKLTPSALTSGTNVTLDFATNEAQTLAQAHNVTFATSNLAAGASKTIRITCDGTPRTFTFPAWKFVGGAAPAGIAASKVAILTITSFATSDAECVAAYSVQP